MSNIKKVDHISLAVNSTKKGIFFYTNVFEYRVIFEEDNMTKQIQSMTGLKEIACNIVQLKSDFIGNVLELIEFKNYKSINTQISHPLYPGCAHIGFIVNNLSKMIEITSKYGAKTLGDITDFEAGKSVYCTEPSGTFFEMEELN
ncbi:VOC family protein [Alphaproteobacteria bacterium]|nr:VOC family protein [Alphaproteobacteria bacterium]